MSALLVGYARCSTDQHDLTAQRDALFGLGVEAERIYVDHGLTGAARTSSAIGRTQPAAIRRPMSSTSVFSTARRNCHHTSGMSKSPVGSPVFAATTRIVCR